MNKCHTSCFNVEKFLNNVGENWRNSIYVSCKVCKYGRESCGEDFLVSFDADGRPTFMLVPDANYIFSVLIDKSECIEEISNSRFQYLFEKYIQKYALQEKECPFRQLAGGAMKEKMDI